MRLRNEGLNLMNGPAQIARNQSGHLVSKVLLTKHTSASQHLMYNQPP